MPAARELGLKVILGAWLGVDEAMNERALTRAIELANANTDVVDVLMVGNEVLLRQEQSEENPSRSPQIRGMEAECRRPPQCPAGQTCRTPGRQ